MASGMGHNILVHITGPYAGSNGQGTVAYILFIYCEKQNVAPMIYYKGKTLQAHCCRHLQHN